MVAVALLGAGTAHSVRIDDRRVAVESASEARENARRRARAPKPVVVPTRAERWEAQADELVRQPWMRTLRSIERVTEAPVYLLSLTVEPGRGSIRLDAEAPAYDHVLAYLRALNEEAELMSARLVSHTLAPPDPEGVVRMRFSVVAGWRSP
jgi:hypothetical protein